VFSASGSGPQLEGFDIGSDAIGLLRGIDRADLVGDRAVVANLDYRFPLVSVQRGFGTIPFFIRTIHGAVFADAGHAWTAVFARSAVRRSFGAELSIDAVVGYALPLTFTSGVAVATDPVNDRRPTVAFARIGRAF
jgi:outer membrane protein assembly factor BamA